ncbi:MAG: right-handed parallel beta-helix repeat-containing protein [Xanthobacteraceae bacterium]|nr:right-handed parallel beta-helix repeat-containing protein [Xanthobacteraceae bacterium]
MMHRRIFLTASALMFAPLSRLAAQQPVNLLADFKTQNDGLRDVSAILAEALKLARPVFVPKGTYRIDHTVFLPSGAVIYGDGGAVFTKTPSQRHDIFVIENAKEVVLKNLQFDGVRRLGKGTSGHTVRIKSALNVGVRDCVFRDGLNLFIYAPSRDVDVHGCRFLGGRDGVALGDSTVDGISEHFAEHIRITGNHFENIYYEALDVNADSRHVIFANNTIVNCSLDESAHGEVIDIGGDTCSDIIVQGNRIDLSKRRAHGINVKTSPQYPSSSTSRIVVANNLISNGRLQHEAGIRFSKVSGAVCTGNIVAGTDNGIVCEDGARDIAISGNRVEANARALTLRNGAASVVVSGNSFEASGENGVGVAVEGEVASLEIGKNIISAPRPFAGPASIMREVQQSNTLISRARP